MHFFNYEPVCNLSWIKRCLSKLKSGKIDGIEVFCLQHISYTQRGPYYFVYLYNEQFIHENLFSQKLGLSLTRMKCRQQFRAILTEIVVKLCLLLAICFHSCKVWSTHEMTIFSTWRSFSKAVTNCYRLFSMNTFMSHPIINDSLFLAVQRLFPCVL